MRIIANLIFNGASLQTEFKTLLKYNITQNRSVTSASYIINIPSNLIINIKCAKYANHF